METNDWPPSNYPIFFALVLLAATAVTLAMGDETLAESLAIYAYYLLVIGVAVRFFELSLSDGTKANLKSAAAGFLRHAVEFIRRVYQSERAMSNNILKSRLHREHRKESSKSVFNIRVAVIRSLFTIMQVSKEVSLYLTVLFVLLCVYGLAFGWWIVSGYLKIFILIIIGFLAVYAVLYVLLRQSDKA
ncbi:MAG: hypothetical protein SCH66_04590 [Methanolobus sp.]|nr:hypothetical protein [Methanolobus sp.]